MEHPRDCQFALLRTRSRPGDLFPCFLLLLVLLSLGTERGAAAPARYENPDYLIDNWQGGDGSKNGLHENSSSCLAQTPDGYLWVGTYGGLARFNGQDFSVPGGSTNAPKPGETIHRLLVDKGGQLWVATERRILTLKDGVWSVTERLDGRDVVVRSFATDPSGRVWYGTLDGKLAMIKNGHAEAVTPPAPFFNSGVFCCTDKKDGSLWLANRGYIGRLTENGWQQVGPRVSDLKPLVAAPARNGGLWVYYQYRHVLVRYQADGSEQSYPAASINEIREIYEDHLGQIWIGSTLSGLMRMTPGNTNLNLSISITNGLANNVVIAITEDAENNMWIGTGSGGLHRLVARRFSNIGLAQGLPNPICRSVIEESDGNYLAGTHGGGVARIQNGHVVSVHRAPDSQLASPSAFVWTALKDHTGRIWLGTFNGGLLYESNGVEVGYPDWPAGLGKTINALFEDSQNRVWVGSYAGMGLIDENGARPYLSQSNQPLARANIRAIAEEKRGGVIWVGTYNKGILRIEKDQVTRFGTNDGVPEGHLTSLAIDDDGTVWAGIYQRGLVGIRAGKVVRLNQDNGLPASTIGSIVADGLGYFWMGSDQGVLRVAAAELHRIWQDPRTQINFKVFDANDGLATLECAAAFQNTALRDHAGRLWFATQKGVSSVNPSGLQLNTNPPPVVIERVSYLDQSGNKVVVENPDRLSVPAGASELTIDYAALSYTAPDKILFASRLEGARHSWAGTNDLRTEIFHTLPPGDYRFHVRAANNDGIWNLRDTVLIFKVEPFVWQTVWFWTLILGGLALAIGFSGWRLARVQLQRQLEKLKLQREHVRLAAVMGATSDLVVFADNDRNILHINPAGQRLLGVDGPGAARITKFSDLYRLEEYDRMEKAAIATAERAGTWEGETCIRNRAGHEIPVSAVIIVDKDASGKINFISAIARDISERKGAEARHAQLEEQLRQSQKMEAVGRLSGGVAHDFNNLLAVIIGNVSLLEVDRTLLPGQREALREIMRASERAASLTRQLLTFSRRQTLTPANVDLNAVMENMGKMFRRILTEEIRMKLEPAAGPVIVHADVGMIEQVLLNLVVNARDAMPEGGVLEIGISKGVLDAAQAAGMTGASAGSFAIMSVKDTGGGIPPEILPRIFEPFFTTKDVGKGTGLGLATVYGIVHQHQGWVTVQSQVGEGTTFQIYLPLQTNVEVLETAPAAPKKTPVGTETVLVVEDEPALRNLVTRTLNQLGYQIIEAAHGQQALEEWEKNREGIDLVLTDVVMPGGISGFELVRRIRLQSPEVKAIYMSGYNAEITTKDTKLEEGVNFIAKPFNHFQLGVIVRNNLDGKSP